MDQRKNQYQSLGICHRLLKFITESLSALAVRPLTLGYPVYGGLAICHRLFDFIMKMLAAQAVKLVTLGPPVPHFDASENIESRMPCEGKSPLAKADSEQSGATEKDDNELPPLQDQDDAKKLSEEVVVKITVEPKARAPEKVVSFNENGEEIIPVKKKKKKTAPQKLLSMEREKKEEQKPLKSILKMGSKSTDN